MKQKVMGKFSQVKLKGMKWASLIGVSLSSTAALAVNNDVSLPSSDSSYLQKIINWMQEVMDVIGGAGTLFVAFLSACAAILLWVTMPKQSGGALAWIMRVCIGAIAAFNIALLFAWLQK